jgi:hypothetical protein
MNVPKWLRRWLMKQNRAECHKLAERILFMGLDNEHSLQQHLDKAKDELYSAARIYHQKELELL